MMCSAALLKYKEVILVGDEEAEDPLDCWESQGGGKFGFLSEIE
jgi:hypothetical protein